MFISLVGAFKEGISKKGDGGSRLSSDEREKWIYSLFLSDRYTPSGMIQNKFSTSSPYLQNNRKMGNIFALKKYQKEGNKFQHYM